MPLFFLNKTFLLQVFPFEKTLNCKGMINVGFPVFDLKSSNEYLFIAGGGGSKEYGKENGIMVIRKSSFMKDTNKPDYFYKTSDLIIYLQIFSERKEEINNLFSEIELDNAPQMADGFESTEIETHIPFETEVSSSEEVINEKIKNKDEPNQSKLEKKIPDRKPSNSIFILAIGDYNFYILKLSTTLSLHCKIEKRIKFAFLNKHLFLLKTDKIKGFYDIVNNPSSIRFKTEKIGMNTTEPTEEYVYKLYKRKREVIALNENCTRDIPRDWESFFVVGNKIHKILKQQDVNIFVFRNQKYKIAGKISRVTVHKEGIIFYSNTAKEGNLYFIGNEEKVYKLPRITAISIWNDYTAVATVEGNLVIYLDGFYFQKSRVSNLPITGITIDKSRIYYSQLDGEVKCIRNISNLERILKYTSIIVILIAIFAYLIFKGKNDWLKNLKNKFYSQ